MTNPADAALPAERQSIIRRHWPAFVVAGVGLVGALLISFVLGVASMQGALTEARSEAVDAKKLTEAMEKQRDGALGMLNEERARIQEQKEELSKREQGVADREKAVAVVEEQIAANRFGPGLVVVGRDVAAGEYRTDGSDRCYYVWKTDTTSDASIIDNNIVQGSATVTLRDGDIFESSRCGDWTRL